MKLERIRLPLPTLWTLAALAALAAPAAAQVGSGLLSPDVATREELAALPGLTEEIVDAVFEARPFADAVAFDEFLAESGLDAEAREAVYAKAFVHLDLNTADSESFQLVPGVGKRMAHEFAEYRPWKSWAQFDKEIGKYVDDDAVARLKQYLFIPLNLNTATSAEFMTIPGVGERMAHELEEYRPWTSRAQFDKEIGKYVDEREVARLWRYVVID
jgi:DNA uptake protein ComE-like DNA-binding protein